MSDDEIRELAGRLRGTATDLEICCEAHYLEQDHDDVRDRLDELCGVWQCEECGAWSGKPYCDCEDEEDEA